MKPMKTWHVSLLVAAAVMVGPRSAWPACPESLCDCLGEAAKFGAVGADSLAVKVGISGILDPQREGGSAEGDVCTKKLVMSAFAETGADTNVLNGGSVALAATGVAARLTTKGSDPSSIPNTNYGDFLATGGGTVVGQSNGGPVDTTGAHPGIASCQQAILDMRAASQALAALAPTQTLPALRLFGDVTYTIVAGPGVNVVSTPEIRLESAGRNTYEDPFLVVQMDSATAAVIINTDRLSVSANAAISGDTRVVINLAGVGPMVRLARDPGSGVGGTVDPMVLAPERTVTVRTDAHVANVYGRKVQLLGGVSTNALAGFCP